MWDPTRTPPGWVGLATQFFRCLKHYLRMCHVTIYWPGGMLKDAYHLGGLIIAAEKNLSCQLELVCDFARRR